LSTVISRQEVRALLERWQRGETVASQVHIWAEDRHAVSAFEPEDEVVNELLGQLDMLNLNLITAEDVPALLRALDDLGDTDRVIQDLERYFEGIDLVRRSAKCAGDPLYAPLR
jgi:hypothetical protein